MLHSNKIAKIFSQFKVDFAYQFGSTVSGEVTKESDVDIAVCFKEDLSARERFEARLLIMEKLAHSFKRNVDVVVLNDLRSLFFRYVIIKEGRLIYDSGGGNYVDFESRAMGLYFDFAPFLEMYNKAYVERNLK